MMNVSLLAMSSVGHQWHEVPVSTGHTVATVHTVQSQSDPSTVHSLTPPQPAAETRTSSHLPQLTFFTFFSAMSMITLISISIFTDGLIFRNGNIRKI